MRLYAINTWIMDDTSLDQKYLLLYLRKTFASERKHNYLLFIKLRAREFLIIENNVDKVDSPICDHIFFV